MLKPLESPGRTLGLALATAVLSAAAGSYNTNKPPSEVNTLRVFDFDDNQV